MINLGRRSQTFVNITMAVVMLLGLLTSVVIYHTGNSIAAKTQGLITQKLPTYDLLRQLNNDVIEQERFLYEFYATEDFAQFNSGYKKTKTSVQQALAKLTEEFGPIPPLRSAEKGLFEFDQTTDAFIDNISSPATNWSLAREHLQQLSVTRSEITPQIQTLIRLTQSDVRTEQKDISLALDKVSFFVVFYALATMVVVYSIMRAWKAYIASAAHSERLSLFPKRNPNPVISLDVNNQVTFSNPASDKFLEKIGHTKGQAHLLLANNIKHYQQAILTDENLDSMMFEYAIADRFVQCEIHWLNDQQQWDIHLTDITSRKQVEKELKYRASHDPDTGLKKRHELQKAVVELSVEKNSFCFGVVEIRSYGQLVSTNGLTTASEVVKQVGLSLQYLVTHDTQHSLEAYRIGEKSFALLVSDSHEIIPSLIQDIDSYIDEQDFSHQYQVKLDYGFACYPMHGGEYAELHINAMAALDRSARTNDKSFVVFDPELGAKLAYQQQLTVDLVKAISLQEFELYFQPQLSLHTRQIIGAEVLIRWQRNGQWVSPAEFIPLAESAGLIVELGDWILQTACEKARSYFSDSYQNAVVAVNISPLQFGRPDFLDKVRDVLKTSGLAPKNLELEITEGVIIYNEQETIDTLVALKELGVKLAIDDFGTGYSSLSYLKKFDIDKLKIDQSFIRSIQIDRADQSIVRTIIELGRNFELQLIAEGVEEQSQLNLLKSMGCDEIQGYFFSRPLPEADFEQFLAKYDQQR
jgi:EAL domain-containing protein (putative c-di-GMP-specific phosphodiesterase class I)/GGDEF domain-containing protein